MFYPDPICVGLIQCYKLLRLNLDMISMSISPVQITAIKAITEFGYSFNSAPLTTTAMQQGKSKMLLNEPKDIY